MLSVDHVDDRVVKVEQKMPLLTALTEMMSCTMGPGVVQTESVAVVVVVVSCVPEDVLQKHV